MAESESSVAVWWVRYGAPSCELYADEQAAASAAAFIADELAAAVLGAQFADGRVIAAQDWAAFGADRARRVLDIPPAPERTITDPFWDWEVAVAASAPSWLGRQ